MGRSRPTWPRPPAYERMVRMVAICPRRRHTQHAHPPVVSCHRGMHMLSKEILRRLRDLAADPPQVRGLRPSVLPRPAAGGAPARDAEGDPFLEQPPLLFPRTPDGVTIEEVIGGTEVRGRSGLPFWVCELRLSEVWPEAAGRMHSLRESITSGLSGIPLDIIAPFEAGPSSVLFLDLETWGFPGAPVYLVGTLEIAPEPTVKLYLARDYPEEEPLVHYVNSVWQSFECLVTFNGKSFDVPLLTGRMRLWRAKPAPPPHHVDLLHIARKRYRGELPNYRLQTLERHLLGRERADDLSSAEVPGIFSRYMEVGDPRLLAPILQHNALDLISLADLLARYIERL